MTDAPRILVVDDEPDLLDLLAYNLEREGYTVATAPDGEAALHLAAATPPDLILLDVMMPRLDGLATCRRIREDARLRTVPVLMLTALDADADHVRGLDVGADAYLSKDVAMPVLLSQAGNPAFTGDPNIKAFIDMLPTSQFDPFHPQYAQMQELVKTAMQSAITGAASPKDALDKAAAADFNALVK